MTSCAAAEGANDASAFVQNTVATCPDTKIVLGGFSQGAAVIDGDRPLADHPQLGFTPTRCRPPSPITSPQWPCSATPSIKLLGGPLTALSPGYGLQDNRPVQRGRSGVFQR